jgi:hypothetical protein
MTREAVLFHCVPVCLVALLIAAPIQAQGVTPAQLRVTVVDQTGASITSATVRVIAGGGAAIDEAVDARGQATFEALAAGAAQLHVESAGFASFDGSVTLRRGSNAQTVTLTIAGVEEQVVVNEETSVTDRSGNSMTTTLEEDDIAGLPDDPDELADALDQMTGGAGAVFQVNGFRGGRLPPKSEIRQIRFHLNSFAADNHDAGRVIVEIITKPNVTAWTGNANLGLRSDVLDARNAFAPVQTPEQLRRFNAGLRGPLVKGHTAIRLNVDGNRSFDSGTIVAQLPDARVADLVKRPVDQTNLSVAIEHALTANQTLRIDYRDGQNNRGNLGVGDFNLAERAYNTTSRQHVMRAQVQGLVGKKLNDLRVQVQSQQNASASLSSAPSIIVIDAFSAGGAGVASTGTTTNVEIADDLDFALGRKHAMRVGFLFDHDGYRQSDGRNAAGTFTFGSLAGYLAGQPNTFTQRLGEVQTSFAMSRLGAYWEDDVRVNKSFSYSVGVREELQNHVNDAFNVMPRLGFTLTPPGSRTTFRGGYGLFYDWYDSNLYDQTLRVNGIAQRDLLILAPGYPDPFSGASVVLRGGRVQADPDLKMPYEHQVSIGIERPLSKSLNVQASYMMIRGFNQLRSRNVNAPDASGVRPDPTIGTVTQIESSGRAHIDRVNINANYRIPQKRLLFSANYTLSSVQNHADSPLQLPANSLDPDSEWGPASQDVRHRFNGMMNMTLPAAIRANVTATAASAAPYTITTGRDDNGDGVSNDRPAGVGRNSARGTGRFDLSVRLTRGFAFGSARAGGGGIDGGAPVQIAGGPGGAGGPLPGPGGPGIGARQANRRFNVDFYVQASNVLNHTDFLNYSGNLQSPFFGLPTSAAAARRVELGAQFRF